MRGTKRLHNTTGVPAFLSVLGLGLLLVLVMPLAGEGEAQAKPPSHCSLLKQQEVADFMSKPVEPGEETFLGCAWVPKGKRLSYLTVLIRPASDEAWQSAIRVRPGFAVIKIKGLGEDAFIKVRQSSGNVLDTYVRKGKYLVRFNMPFLGVKRGSPRLERFKKLVRKAISRL